MTDHDPSGGVLVYRRARFATLLPVGALYTRTHFWLRETGPGLWRVGLTAYGVRMLGEMVECEFEIEPGCPVRLGQKVGWIEGFKAVSDLSSLVEGEFDVPNQALGADVTLVETDPYGEGWLYQGRGRHDPDTTDAKGYTAILDAEIDRMLARRRQEAADE